ncbi:hypothetical protein LMG26857_03678 [Achromobacter anxifer]|uniref:hypothetical protein n=1 Tax=Achromobacter anxifer TaxID=1287737 RepID=UPI00155C9E1F|nr:hypothetical protein [Achromobacter anxifer]CAB5514619.1 hypothetical protein LMG26857_03678 [Achromobacter anxifer]
MSKTSVVEIRPALRSLLLAHGFNSQRYNPNLDPGEYLNKVLTAGNMPHFKVEGIDNDFIVEDSLIMVEVTPGELVQLVAQEIDYHEDGVSIFSKRGLKLLEDAGVDPAAVRALQSKG